MTLKDYMAARLPEIEETLYSSFEALDNNIQNNFIDMLKYPIKAGGKRFRPILSLLTSELFECDYKNALIPAAAIEMVHTYSLVHDDLPAMDNDELRRGMPTCHIKYGEANAILIGDALLTHAFYILSNSNVNDSTLRRLLKEVSYASGHYGMVMGQYLDLYAENNTADFEMLKNIHSKKTGAIIKSAVRIGAIVAGLDESDTKGINTYGDTIGLAFQIQDDILDKVSSKEELGKTIGKDEENNKLTYVKEFGLENAQKKANEAVEKAIDAISSYKKNEARECLIELAKYTVERKS